MKYRWKTLCSIMIRGLGYWPVKRDTVLELRDSQGNTMARRESSELFPPIPIDCFHWNDTYNRIMDHFKKSRK